MREREGGERCVKYVKEKEIMNVQQPSMSVIADADRFGQAENDNNRKKEISVIMRRL